MLILETVNKSLEVKLDGAVITSQLPVSGDWIDMEVGASHDPQSFALLTAGAVAVVIVPAPAAGKLRKIQCLSIPNLDTAAATVTVQTNVGGVKWPRAKAVLALGDTLHYEDARGWYVMAPDGSEKSGIVGPPGPPGPGSSLLHTLTRIMVRG